MKKLYFFYILILALLFNSCTNNDSETIKVGFIAGLSGKYSTLGHSVKNGVSLAFEENNYLINNKKVELILKDDKQDKNEAKKVVTELIEDNIKVIIGNTTSSMTKISLKEINKKDNILLISATASSDEFSDKNDNFLRTQVSNNYEKFNFLSDYLIKNSLLSISLIYDEDNISYVNSYANNLEKSLIKKGGSKYLSRIKINQEYETIIKKLKNNDSDLIFIVANSLDASKLIQYLKINNINKKILCSGWSKTKELITSGGKAVEDVLFVTSYDENSNKQEYLDFVANYKKRYKKEPSGFAALSYETAMLIIKTLEKDENVLNLKKNIIKEKTFQGLQGKIVFNKFGDVKRDSFLMTIKNSKFVKLDY